MKQTKIVLIAFTTLFLITHFIVVFTIGILLQSFIHKILSYSRGTAQITHGYVYSMGMDLANIGRPH